jgi:tRNA-dihydrouridine synthase
MLPWFSEGRFPLYLAPMAGVSDTIFRKLCKEHGADVLITEFVSSEGVFRRNERTREYLQFDEIRRQSVSNFSAQTRSIWQKQRGK